MNTPYGLAPRVASPGRPSIDLPAVGVTLRLCCLVALGSVLAAAPTLAQSAGQSPGEGELPTFEEQGGYMVATVNYCVDSDTRQAGTQKASLMLSGDMHACLADGDCKPGAPYPVSILFHGFPGKIEDRGNLLWQQAFVDQGMISLSVDYRPHTDGRWSIAQNTAEGRCAVRWLRQFLGSRAAAVDTDNITVAGHSVGSLLSQSLLFAPRGQTPVCDSDEPATLPHYQVRLLEGMGLAELDGARGCERVDPVALSTWNTLIGPIERKWGQHSTRVHGGALTSTMAGYLDIGSECTILPPLFNDAAGRTRFPLVTYRPAAADTGLNRKLDGEIYCGAYRDLQDAARSFGAISRLDWPQAEAFRQFILRPALTRPRGPFVVGYRGSRTPGRTYETIVPLRAYMDREKRQALAKLSPISWLTETDHRVPVAIVQARQDHGMSPWPGAVSLGMALRQFGHVAQTVIVPRLGHNLVEQGEQRTRNQLSATFARAVSCSIRRRAACESAGLDLTQCAAGDEDQGCSLPREETRFGGEHFDTPEAWIEHIGERAGQGEVEVLDRYISAGRPRVLLRPEVSAVTRPHQHSTLRRSPDRLVNRFGARHNLYTGLKYRYDFHHFVPEGRGWADLSDELQWRVLNQDHKPLASEYAGPGGHCESVELFPTAGPQSQRASAGEDIAPWCQFLLSPGVDGKTYYIQARAGGSKDWTETVTLQVHHHPYDSRAFPATAKETSLLWWQYDQVEWRRFTSSAAPYGIPTVADARPGGLVDVFGDSQDGPLTTADGIETRGMERRAVLPRDTAARYRACFTETDICSPWLEAR